MECALDHLECQKIIIDNHLLHKIAKSVQVFKNSEIGNYTLIRVDME